jgi:hypothetical protein
VTTANKVRLPAPSQATTTNTKNKSSGFFSEAKQAIFSWLRTFAMSDKPPSSLPEKRLKFGGTFRVDDGIQELVLNNGYTLLTYASSSGLQLSMVNEKQRNLDMTFVETIYSLPPLHIYAIAGGGTREVCGDTQKILMPDGHVIVLDSRGVVMVSNGTEIEQFRKSHATNSSKCMKDERTTQRVS